MQRSGVRVQPRDLRPAVSPEANEMILRALSFAPQDRFQTAREFGEALAQTLGEEPGTLGHHSSPNVPATQLATSANPAARQTGDLSRTIAGRYEPAKVDTLNQPAVEDDARPAGMGMRISIALVVLLVIGAAAGILVWKREAIFGGRERSLFYSLTVQKMRDGKPFQSEFESSGREVFENGWKFRMNIDNSQNGYLYLLNQGPASANVSTYNVLFPESKTNGGSPQVTANQKLQTEWMRFDDNQGTEKFWIVWSASPVKELEAVKDVVNERDLGEIKDATKARALRDFLNSSPKSDATKDSARQQTLVKSRGDVLVSMIELEHH
jgi:hypothetical protein